MWRFPELDREHFASMMRWVLIVGTVLVGLSALRGIHGTGTVARLVLDVAYVTTTIGWLLGLLGGGTVLHQAWNGYQFSIDIRGLFILVAALASLNLVYYGLRFAQERGYLPGGGDDPSTDATARAVTIEYAE